VEDGQARVSRDRLRFKFNGGGQEVRPTRAVLTRECLEEPVVVDAGMGSLDCV